MARYRIVPERSTVWIDAQSTLHPIHSASTGLEGWLDVEVADGRLDLSVEPHARLEIEVERMSSGNVVYDREMQRRVDARRYPTIRGELDAVREVDGNGRYAVRGDVTFHGVTNAFEREMTVDVLDDGTLKLEGEHLFDVRDFGITPPKILMFRVHPEVAVRVSILAEVGEEAAV